MEKEKILEILNKFLTEGEKVKATQHQVSYLSNVVCIDEGYFNAWRGKLLTFLDSTKLDISNFKSKIENIRGEFPSKVDDVCHIINAIIDSVENGYIEIDNKTSKGSVLGLENIFNKFHKIVRQLRSRHDGRNTLDIEDEYDVQDLLHALLHLYFDDIRAEEWTPSYAGSALRMDFLLKEQEIVIETKKTRKNMTPKQLGEELITDIEKYKSHPNCKKLYCFVYDPEGYLANPNGIKNDLENAHKDFLKVFIKPD